jgi:hypothetical protein
MYMDKMLEFSDAQDLSSTSNAQEVVSTDIADLGASETNAFGTAILPDPGNAGSLIWHVLIGVAHTGGGGATMVVELVTKSTASTMSSGSTVIDTFTIPNLAAAGTHYQRPVPMEAMAASDRYMAVLYRGGVDQTDTLTVDSWISMDRNLTDSSGGAIQTGI